MFAEIVMTVPRQKRLCFSLEKGFYEAFTEEMEICTVVEVTNLDEAMELATARCTVEAFNNEYNINLKVRRA